MGSSRRWVGRLRGGSCSNDDGGNVVALAVARLDGGLQEESMRVRAGDGRWRTKQQEGAVDDGAGGGWRGKRGGADNARRAGGGQQNKKDRDGGHNMRWQWRPRYSAAALHCMGGGASQPPPGAALWW
jgi:hypothetical protein